MENKFAKFLLNDELNNQTFNDQSYYPKEIKVHKEKYDDRFIVLYLKTKKSSLVQDNYTIGGYLDKKEKCIYGKNYRLDNLLPIDGLIKTISFESLNDKFWNEISKYIEDYSFKNEKDLKDIAKEKYSQFDDWKMERYKKDVREQFIEEDNPSIKLDQSYSNYVVVSSEEYNGKNIFVDYLNYPNSTIKKYSNLIIDYDDNKSDLGLELLIYRDKISYLNDILENKNGKFNDLYINKKMYHAIKNIDAKTLNITIQYGEQSMTFKFDYDSLERDLKDDSRSSCGYGVAYEKVSKFIQENSSGLDYRRKEDFLFSHITSITYGKKELYHNEIKDYEKEKLNEYDDIEIEM